MKCFPGFGQKKPNFLQGLIMLGALKEEERFRLGVWKKYFTQSAEAL